MSVDSWNEHELLCDKNNLLLNQSGVAREQIVEKIWGYEKHIINTELYCMKELFIKANKRSSIHFHINKHETLLVIKGSLLIKIYNKDSYIKNIYLHADQTSYRALIIAPFLIHELIALDEDVHIIEASTFSEDNDSIRIKND